MQSLPTFDLVLFGGTGDLAMRKLLPALYRRSCGGQINKESRIIGAARAVGALDARARGAVRDRGLVAILARCIGVAGAGAAVPKLVGDACGGRAGGCQPGAQRAEEAGRHAATGGRAGHDKPSVR